MKSVVVLFQEDMEHEKVVRGTQEHLRRGEVVFLKLLLV